MEVLILTPCDLLKATTFMALSVVNDLMGGSRGGTGGPDPFWEFGYPLRKFSGFEHGPQGAYAPFSVILYVLIIFGNG